MCNLRLLKSLNLLTKVKEDMNIKYGYPFKSIKFQEYIEHVVEFIFPDFFQSFI